MSNSKKCPHCGHNLDNDQNENCLKCKLEQRKSCIFCKGLFDEGICGGCGGELGGNLLFGCDDFEVENDDSCVGLTGRSPAQIQEQEDLSEEKSNLPKKPLLPKFDSLKKISRTGRKRLFKENTNKKQSAQKIHISEQLQNRKSLATKKDIVDTYEADFLIKFLTLYGWVKRSKKI